MTAVDMTEFRKNRKLFLGGSDSYAACDAVGRFADQPFFKEFFFGKNSFTTYHDKTSDDMNGEETDAMRRGRLWEESLALIYEDETGTELRRVEKARVHKDHAFLGANPDRIVKRKFGSERRFVELKTSSARKWWGPDRTGPSGVPDPYLYQCQHYLNVLEADVIDLMVMLGPNDIRLYEIRPHAEFIERMQEKEVKLWVDHIAKRIPPEPKQSTDIELAFPADDGSTVKLDDPEWLEMVRDLTSLDRRIKELAKQKDWLTGKVKWLMGKSRFAKDEKGTLWIDFMTVTEKEPRLDVGVLKKRDPELHAALIKQYGKPPRSSRRFCLKHPEETDDNE